MNDAFVFAIITADTVSWSDDLGPTMSVWGHDRRLAVVLSMLERPQIADDRRTPRERRREKPAQVADVLRGGLNRPDQMQTNAAQQTTLTDGGTL